MDKLSTFNERYLDFKSLEQSIAMMMDEDSFMALLGEPLDALIVDSLMIIAQAIDQHAQILCDAGAEPEYHNRQHAYEVITAMRMLIEQEDQADMNHSWPSLSWPSFTSKERGLMLIAALSHDYLHPGGINHSPFELEIKSAIGVEKLLQEQGVDNEDIFFKLPPSLR